VLSRVLTGHPDLRQRLITAIVPQALRSTVEHSVTTLPTSAIPFVAGLIGLLFSGTGVVFSVCQALNHVAAVPYRLRPGFASRYVRVFVMLAAPLLGAVAVGALRHERKPDEPWHGGTQAAAWCLPIRGTSRGACPRLHPKQASGNTDRMVNDTARDRAIYHALKAADEIAAALQAHLIEEHGADPDRTAAQSPATNSLKLLRQARERLGEGLRAVEAGDIAESDQISLRNH
jgi:hypothetical protein